MKPLFNKDSIVNRGLVWNGFHMPYNNNNIVKAKVLRKNMTTAEKLLWFNFLRNYKYRVIRQKPIDHYIADFYCARLRLVIEVDGLHHLVDQVEYDKMRTNILTAYSLRILRFTNNQVLHEFNSVCRIIEEIPPFSTLT